MNAGWLFINLLIDSAANNITPTETTTAIYIIHSSLARPTAVMIESSENTISINNSCKRTLEKLFAL